MLDVVSDLCGTLAHLVMHQCRLLRAYHLVHHQRTSTFPAKLGVPLALMPLPSTFLLWCFLSWTMLASMAHHTTAKWGYWVSLCWAVPCGLRLKPAHHLVHHRDPSRHYGESWAMWDWLLVAWGQQL